MDQDEKPSPPPKKPRFTPKPPSRRNPKLIDPKREAEDKDDSDEAAKALLQRVNEHLGKRGPKVETKSSVQVAFSHEASSSGKIRSFGVPRQASNITINCSGSNSRTSADDGKIITCLPSTATQDEISSSVNIVESSYKKKKEFQEHWDYDHSYYPIILPLRPPYSGNPELLDEREFGKTAMDLDKIEKAINPASELGLLEYSDEPRMLFLQLPTTLPLETLQEKRMSKPPLGASEKGKEKVGASKPPLGASEKGKEKVGASKPPKLENIPAGHVGKLLVYKSGAIKWKIGEVVFNVAPGVSCNFAQDVVAINTAEKHACTLGEVGKRAVVCPDIDYLLENNLNLG